MLFRSKKREYKKKNKNYIKEKKIKNIKSNSTCNRYICFNENYPIGEIGIRTTLDEFWINRVSQIFYKIRPSERNKGHGTNMLGLALKECKNLKFTKVRINCDDNNIGSKKVIIRNGGIVDIKNYQTKEGYSSSYIINL